MNGWDNSASAYRQIPLTVSQFSIKVTYSDRINGKGPGKGIQDMIAGKARQLMQ